MKNQFWTHLGKLKQARRCYTVVLTIHVAADVIYAFDLKGGMLAYLQHSFSTHTLVKRNKGKLTWVSCKYKWSKCLLCVLDQVH